MQYNDPNRLHFLLSTHDLHLPLFIDSIGYHDDDRLIRRQHGYPYYHWLQTLEGAGTFFLTEHDFILYPGQAVILPPNTYHVYDRHTPYWKVCYITFGGKHVNEIMESLDLHVATIYDWESRTPLDTFVLDKMNRIRHNDHFSGIEGSLVVYELLTTIKQYGQINRQPSFSDIHERLLPLIQWLEANFSDASITREQMAERMYMSPQYLSKLFNMVFGMSPYAYLIQLRIRKAKEQLHLFPDIPVRTLANQVGFGDTSHFIATFKRITGFTPKQFKKHH